MTSSFASRRPGSDGSRADGRSDELHRSAATETPEVVLARLRSRLEGLTSEEAAGALELAGRNSLPRSRELGTIGKIVRQLTHFFAVMLWCAALLAWIGGMPQLAIAIVVVVVVNGLFSFAQEERASRAAAALGSLLPERASVLRDGERTDIEASDVVPGDILLLREGDRIPADARLIRSERLLVDQSALTGESEPDEKDPGIVEQVRGPLSAARNLVFSGTYVSSGSGRSVVIATGGASVLGTIATITQQVSRRPTPLQLDLRRTVKIIAASALVAGLVFFAVAAVRGTPVRDGFLFAVGVIVALVPEGLLPTLTLALAMSATRLAHRGALVRVPASVETLGATTVICSDKTGTMTTNQMTARAVVIDDIEIDASGLGWNPGGALTIAAVPLDQEQRGRVLPLLRVAALCGDAEIRRDGDRWRCLGDPTEGSLVALARKGGVERESLTRVQPRLRSFPFDARRRRMTTVHASAGGGTEALMKGAPEQVLGACGSVALGSGVVTLTAAERDRILAQVRAMTARGLRVLACANRALDDHAGRSMEELEQGFTFLGLVGLEDPIRPEVPDAIARCIRAGIRVVMITGDHPNTARSVARAVGIPGVQVIEGADLPTSDVDLAALVADARVGIIARVEPEQKLRIARALQANGHVVAMTGDGVNDAPALRQADIGVAMGITGTDVAREAADLVLLDDNFAHIVEAVEEGRAAFDNTRNFLTYHLTDNVAELAPFVVWALSGGSVPLLLSVLQVLALDIGTDLLPALALGAEAPATDAMRRPPRGSDAHLLDRQVLLRAFGWLGPVEAVVSLGVAIATAWLLFGWAPGLPLPSSGTELAMLSGAVFASIVLMQMANAFECRSPTASAFRRGRPMNRLLVAAVLVEGVALCLFLFVPAVARILHQQAPPPLGWLLVGLAPVVFVAAEEVRKWVRSRPRAEP